MKSNTKQSPTKVLNKKVFLWGLYDFANTPLTTAMGGLFLAQWIVVDNKLDDIWYGATFTLSTILLLLTSPFWGAWSDRLGKRMPFLKWITFLLIGIGVAMGLVATSSMDRIPRAAIVLGLFFLLQYFYQVSLIFFNSLLDFLSTPETRGKVSGIGEAFAEISWLFGNIMLLPFASGAISIIGQPGRGQVFLPAALALALFGLPMIIWLKEGAEKKAKPKISISAIFAETVTGLKQLLRENKNVATFLLGFMFVSDALLTASLYFAIYLNTILKLSDTQKVIVVALLEIVAAISAIVISRISDKVGIKKILILSCINLTVVYAFVGMVNSLAFLYILAIFIGFGYGGFYSTSRALLVKLSPAEKLGEYFGFYSTFQKFASIIGPVTWGLIILLLKDYGPIRYRIGILSLSLLMLIGTLIICKVKEKSVLKQKSLLSTVI